MLTGLGIALYPVQGENGAKERLPDRLRCCVTQLLWTGCVSPVNLDSAVRSENYLGEEAQELFQPSSQMGR